MDKALLEKIQDLSGIEDYKNVPKFIVEVFDNWKPKDIHLKTLINMHNKVYSFITQYAGRDNVDFSSRNRAVSIIEKFNDAVNEAWREYVPKNIKNFTMDYHGEKIKMNPSVTIKAALRNAKDFLEDAKSFYDWNSTYPYLDNSYSSSHAVLKIIKALQDKGLAPKEA